MDKEIVSEVHITIYKPINELPETHKPQFEFSGEVLSMKMVGTIEFQMRKALRHYKTQLGAKLLKEKGESE